MTFLVDTNIVELKSDEDFELIYPLLQELNSLLNYEDFKERLPKMRLIGYRCIAYLDNVRYVGACGFWHGTRFWCGDFIDIDNLIVTESHRKYGVGAKLVAWVENEAKRLGCNQTGLDSYTTQHSAHRFYFREGYIIRGYHFTKPCQ